MYVKPFQTNQHPWHTPTRTRDTKIGYKNIPSVIDFQLYLYNRYLVLQMPTKLDQQNADYDISNMCLSLFTDLSRS